ncbi:hypothetical protein AJ78_03739 [Emergomyces pasteurianus Ep9510]|uniref:Uncharacterized protein n=1 Tax=Emergomyces pasteurianus Ep9510 TaxID=1447872 RepID=A0A1J9PJI6_9EURO|nr:hypothetical protein AJ78_03739 [Emergomyces pasteurianus Ep9510]
MNNPILDSLRREKEACKHLGQVEVIPPDRPMDAGIEMPYMSGGTAQDYLNIHEIDLDKRLRWITSITSVASSGTGETPYQRL